MVNMEVKLKDCFLHFLISLKHSLKKQNNNVLQGL